jgi:hypothetical protein
MISSNAPKHPATITTASANDATTCDVGGAAAVTLAGAVGAAAAAMRVKSTGAIHSSFQTPATTLRAFMIDVHRVSGYSRPFFMREYHRYRYIAICTVVCIE